VKLRLSLSLLTALALTVPACADVVLYSNGPVNGTLNADLIDGTGSSGQTLSDGFVASNSGNVTTLEFVEWVDPPLTPTSISWALGTSAFGSDISSGSTTQVEYTFLFANEFDTSVYDVTVTGLSGSLTAGQTYYLTLNGANDSGSTGNVGWDANDGPATCYFYTYGFPSHSCGGSNTFSLIDSTSATPEPSSLMLLGSAVLGAASVLRRKMFR
jgi:PEP-CTERM motif